MERFEGTYLSSKERVSLIAELLLKGALRLMRDPGTVAIPEAEFRVVPADLGDQQSAPVADRLQYEERSH